MINFHFKIWLFTIVNSGILLLILSRRAQVSSSTSVMPTMLLVIFFILIILFLPLDGRHAIDPLFVFELAGGKV